MNTVWLKDLLIKLLNDPNSMLFQRLKIVTSFVDSKICTICLYEPDFNDSTCFAISEKGAIITQNVNNSNEEKIKIAIESKKVYSKEKLCIAPLYFDNASAFGYLLMNGEVQNIDNFKEAVVALSYYLYNDVLGSIVESYHDTVLKVENLSIDYKNGKLVNKVVKNVDVCINESEFTMIFGPSGSGKSSILNVLGGMLSATRGKVFYKGKDITKFNEKQKTEYRCNTVGFIFQKFNLISDLTIEENIRIAASLVKNPLSVHKVLELVGLVGKEKYYPNQLSGGEQQRVCIARALVKRSELLLCDEPTGSLDTVNALQIMKLLQNISKQKGIPVVVITHNPNFVVMADHYIRLSNGGIVEDILQPFALRAENSTID